MTRDNVKSLPAMQEVEREARTWAARIDGDTLTEEELVAFDAWRDQSPLHADAYSRISQFWSEFEIADRLADYAESDVAQDAIQSDKSIWNIRPIGKSRRAVFARIAASIAILATSVLIFEFSQSPQLFRDTYATVVGEQQNVSLPDGSFVVLNTESVIEVSFTDKARIIKMPQGEAFFDVTPDIDRPFLVTTEKGTVRAVGTAFSINLQSEALDVIVTEGRVALTVIDDFFGLKEIEAAEGQEVKHSPYKNPIVELSAGQSISIVDQVNSITVLAPEALQQKLDWRDGELYFDGDTLEEVMVKVGRYTGLRIDIEGDALKSQEVVAYYKIGDVERLFEALSVMSNIQVEWVDQQHVRLYRASDTEV